MIKFESDGPKLKEVLFAGDIQTLLAELTLEISLMYGTIKNGNEALGEMFKDLLISSLSRDGALHDVVFSSTVFNAVHHDDSGAFSVFNTTIDEDELKKQLKELLSDESE